MKRRDFLRATVASGFVGALPGHAKAVQSKANCGLRAPSSVLPKKLGGMPLQHLRDDLHDRLFKRFLPFWNKSGLDMKVGGIMCELNDDGTVHSDEKDIWYQGRAIWVYSFLYNNFGKNPRWLEVAKKLRDFMVNYMYTGNGTWCDSVHRDGGKMEGTGQGVPGSVSGWLFAAGGLAEYYKAARQQEDVELAKESILASANAYDDPGYMGVDLESSMVTNPVASKGLRSQGHSMVIVRILSQFLSYYDDPKLEKLQAQHVDAIMNKYWNPEYGITNEYLLHDYSRIPQYDIHMHSGHSIETQWMVMYEALRSKDKALFDEAKKRIRRILEMCWDYVFEGLGSEHFFVFKGPKHHMGPAYAVKTMWAHSEILIACLTILEYTGETWAKEWYERTLDYTLKKMTTDCGIWRQAVDRFGKNVKRKGISIYRRGNFHQPRCLMLNLLSLEHMIKNNGGLTPFSG